MKAYKITKTYFDEEGEEIIFTDRQKAINKFTEDCEAEISGLYCSEITYKLHEKPKLYGKFSKVERFDLTNDHALDQIIHILKYHDFDVAKLPNAKGSDYLNVFNHTSGLVYYPIVKIELNEIEIIE